MLRKIMLQALFISFFVLMTTNQPGSVSAGINIWTSIGPESRSSTVQTVDSATPVTFYASAYGSVFKSTQGGATNLTSTLTSLWSTFFGGHGHTNGIRSLADSSGDVWVAFTTTATDIPTTADAFDPTHNGNEDIVIAKFSTAGDLLYSTYLGGAYDDVVNSITLDNDGNVYLVGHTFSTDFPTTANALSHVLQGGRDAIVIKLAATGQLVYSTFLGGNNWDYGFTIAVDAQNDIYVGGFTHGSFPVTPGVAQFNFGGSGDGFVAKLHATSVGTTLVFATYLGGYSWEAVSALAVDENGYMYLAMHTHSTDFPTTPGVFDTVCNNCATNIKIDGALVKLSPDASQLIYSTLFGSNTATTGSLVFSGIAIDDVGNAYVTGITTYTDMPVTPDVFQPAYGGGNYDGILVKINAVGSQLLYSTYFGGSGDDRVSDYDALVRDEQGNLYFAGRTSSTNLPVLDPIQSTLHGGYDAYLASFDAENHLLLSTYWGGSEDEGTAIGISVDSHGHVYLAGGTISADFPTAPDAYDPTINGTDYNGFVSKFTITNNALGTWHVATNGSDVTGTGSETNPFATIQHGINAAANGDTVLVHPGTYIENINFNGKNITVTSIDGAEQTIIDGNHNGSVVKFNHGETNNARLTGFTITNGYANGTTWETNSGGGIFCLDAGPVLAHLKIVDNRASEGGGLYYSGQVSDELVVLTNSEISGNQATGSGGGVRFSSDNRKIATVQNTIIRNNTAPRGGGVFFYHAGKVINTLIVNNHAAKGGGIDVDWGNFGDNGNQDVQFINSTIAYNTADISGGGIGYIIQGGKFRNSIIAHNSPNDYAYDNEWWDEGTVFNYCLSPLSLPAGQGNIKADPLFVDPDGADNLIGTPDDNFRLPAGSPAIDAGDNSAVTVAADLDGNQRIVGGVVDMGAFENPFPVPPAPQLKVGQQLNLDPVRAGSQLTYTLRVTNTGNVDLHATITDTLPAHVSPTGILTWTSIITASGGVWTRFITVTVEAGYAGTLTNTVQATTTEGALDLDSIAVNVAGYTIYLPFVLRPSVDDDLLVWYDFEGDFSASGIIADRSGNGRDAQVIGTVAKATGIAGGQAMSLIGNGYIQAQSNPAAGRTDVTFSLWFKTEHPENNYKLASGAWWNWGPGSGWIIATHIPEFWSDDGQGLVLAGQPNNDNQFAAGEWVHEVVTFDGSHIKEYTNGQLVNDWSTTGATLGQGLPMVVGAWPQFSGYNFQGSIDEFKIFGRSLTSREVQALYNQGR